MILGQILHISLHNALQHYINTALAQLPLPNQKQSQSSTHTQHPLIISSLSVSTTVHTSLQWLESWHVYI